MLNKKHNASILVVTIMIMGIVLVTALSISIVSVKERNASIGSSKSNQAYQSADSGIEKVMDVLVKNQYSPVSIAGGCSVINGHAVITGSGYTVELKKAVETDATNCSTIASDIASIKSVGTGGNTQRAIEAAVASSNQVQKQCQFWSNSGDKYDTFVVFPPNGTIANCKSLANNTYGSVVGSKLYTVCCMGDDGSITSCSNAKDPATTTVTAPASNCGW